MQRMRKEFGKARKCHTIKGPSKESMLGSLKFTKIKKSLSNRSDVIDL